ncbi:MAG: type I restriction endonuclease [Candidatus Pedobacter colombiensis]|uniref:Type I restriction endonuclease n=1 Tax=Candidatus Pedobacter colombiensis TaxID=3121371 RepID=A0AAJ5W4F5_9SPHI|nr:type I restriction endonuclease [Pedobacter sp.]WEK18338.1 MAG: type I restriction endonuclease [Pedobacter sp.]
MDFKDEVKQLGTRTAKMIPQIQTEEATKNALIMPFIRLLGFDVFDPFEVNPEFIADIGIKKGEKVDYAIMKDGDPIIIIECKHHLEKLDPHNSQLFRYFHVTKAKFSLLTNGLNYRFYTDLNEPNKMDDKPFFEFNIAEIKDMQIEELKKFHKSYFDIENISNTASDLKFTNELKALITSELRDPSIVFVKHFASQVYQGKLTEKILAQFTELVKRSSNQVLNDAITDRLKTALGKEEANSNETEVKSTAEPVMATETGIVTTEEEIEGYFIVKSILREIIDPKRIVHRDALSYFAILLDDNNRKTICRLYLGNKKYLAVLDENKKEIKHELVVVDDIYNHADLLRAAVEKLGKK